MAQQLRKGWQCGECKLFFQTPGDLDEHVNSYKSRSLAIQDRMRGLTLELQELMRELQQISEHRGLGFTEDYQQLDDEESHKQTRLSCPFPNCKDRQTYTEMRSLQRHFLNHSGVVICPGCGNRFDNARRFDNHLCVSKNRHDLPSRKAKSLQTKLRKTARAELARLMPSNQATFSLGVATGSGTSDHETLQLAAPNVPETTENTTIMDDATAKAVTGHDHVDAAMRNDVLNLTSDAAGTLQYPRGTLLLQNPLDWSYPHLTPSLIMADADLGSTNLYSNTNAVGEVGDQHRYD
ncbi:hypothetical protein CDV31_016819 [Fusarium ambrosium]|uniref:C2H2-type domain-containing protein n=1 Tax=Fusarium ambrosium TaxID=131363 RepID=A0A428S135_9HYPO|nr:hypothetical protein CDV31_016819 [Fusarium ambrosium]